MLLAYLGLGACDVVPSNLAVEEASLHGPPTCLPGLDENEQRCWRLFLDSSMRMLATHGLTLLDVELLDLLAHSDRGAMRMSALADVLMLGPGRVGKRIRSLEKRVLVSRRSTRYDRRGLLVSITATDRAELELAMRTYAQEVRRHYLDRMSRQQMTDLADIHRRISIPLEGLRSAEVAYLAVL